MKTAEKVMIGIVLLSFLLAIYFYPQMPSRMASHWNALGEADGYTSSFWGTFLLPVLIVVMLLIFLAIPRVDPKRENIEKFRKYYDAMIIVIMAFMVYIFLLVVAWNLGMKFEFVHFMSPGFGVLFIFIGFVIGKAKRNWFIGIRTPWTMSSDKVWNKTHTLGSKLFMASGVIAIIGMLFKPYAIWFVIVPVIASAIVSFVYSYFEYRKSTK